MWETEPVQGCPPSRGAFSRGKQSASGHLPQDHRLVQAEDRETRLEGTLVSGLERVSSFPRGVPLSRGFV